MKSIYLCEHHTFDSVDKINRTYIAPPLFCNTPYLWQFAHHQTDQTAAQRNWKFLCYDHPEFQAEHQLLECKQQSIKIITQKHLDEWNLGNKSALMCNMNIPRAAVQKTLQTNYFRLSFMIKASIGAE